MRYILLYVALMAVLALSLSNLWPESQGNRSLSDTQLASIVGGACDACSEGWHTTSDETGGGECQHGPEHDPDCNYPANPNPNCSEVTGTGNCECFKCQGVPYLDPYSLTCEEEIRTYYAWCGRDANNCYDPQTEVCNTEAGAVGAVQESRPSSVVGGGGCSGASGQHAVQIMCGMPSSMPKVHYACASNNCAGQGTWGDTIMGVRTKCKS